MNKKHAKAQKDRIHEENLSKTFKHLLSKMLYIILYLSYFLFKHMQITNIYLFIMWQYTQGIALRCMRSTGKKILMIWKFISSPNDNFTYKARMTQRKSMSQKFVLRVVAKNHFLGKWLSPDSLAFFLKQTFHYGWLSCQGDTDRTIS